jgi:deoxyadenosine/deoxycytidine kinase
MSMLTHTIPSNTLISIAGMVGAGKTTLAMKLAEALGYQTSLEKVDTNPYLEDYYADFQKWSFHLQIYFLAERFKHQKQMVESGLGYVQDRSIYEDSGIFARLQYEQGNMTPRDYQTYQSLFEAMTLTPYFPRPDLLIYLEGAYEQIIQRIKQRGRAMEVQTVEAFWRELYNRYRTWIEQFDICPVLRINIQDYDLIHDPESIDLIVEKVTRFFPDRISVDCLP